MLMLLNSSNLLLFLSVGFKQGACEMTNVSFIKISFYRKYTTTQTSDCQLNVHTVWELLTHWKEEIFQPREHVNQPCADAQEYEPASSQLQSIFNTFNTHDHTRKTPAISSCPGSLAIAVALSQADFQDLKQ